MIVYIHGFNSSPKSLKALQVKSFFAENCPDIDVVIPQIPPYPFAALKLLEDIVVKNQSVIKGIVGSSLGGYLASYLVEKYRLESVVINPAVRPYELLQDHLGWHENPYSGERFKLTETHIIELKSLDTPVISNCARYWLLQQAGDEVLDHRQAVAKYAGCKQTVEAGGNHSFEGFERFLPDIAAFFGLLNENTPRLLTTIISK